jgi:hypothetical protein
MSGTGGLVRGARFFSTGFLATADFLVGLGDSGLLSLIGGMERSY